MGICWRIPSSLAFCSDGPSTSVCVCGGERNRGEKEPSGVRGREEKEPSGVRGIGGRRSRVE